MDSLTDLLFLNWSYWKCWKVMSGRASNKLGY